MDFDIPKLINGILTSELLEDLMAETEAVKA